MDPLVSANTKARIKEAAVIFGIEVDVDAIPAFFTSLEKSASTAEAGEKFALTLEKSGSFENYYPISTALEVDKSARGMADDYADGRLPIELLRSSAITLMKAANSLGIEEASIPYRVRILGTERMPDLEKAARLTELRIRTRSMPSETAELYRDIVKAASEPDSDLPLMVDLYRELDERCGLLKYSNVCPDPYEVFYGGMPLASVEKLASSVVVIQDVLVPKDVFANLSDDLLQRQFRKEAADHIIAARSLPAALASQKLSECSDEDSKKLLRILANQE